MSDFLSFAHTLADAAASVTTRYFGTGITADAKADKSPVTLADTEAETAMRSLIQKQFPAHGIWGEEGERINPKAPTQWVLDPIDGTRAFISGYPTFATLIACVENNTSVLGVIDQPVLKQRFVGVKGQATTLNGKEAKVSQITELAQAAIASTSTYYFDDPQRDWFDKLAKSAKSYALGGDAYAYAMLACGQLDAVVDVGLKYYDLAALIPVVEGAGGIFQIEQKGEHYNVIATATPELLLQITQA